MKIYTQLLMISALLSVCTMLNAESNQVKEMMKNASNIMQANQEKTQKAVEDAIKQAADDAKSAMQKLPSFSINALTQNGEPPEPSDDFQWTVANIKLAEEGDPVKGEELAQKGKCSRCHGENGISEDDDTPSIAGQIKAYSLKQMHDYKVGLRDDKSMRKRVRKLSLKDMADLAAYYAEQPSEKMVGQTNGENAPVLAVSGDSSRFMLACESCHNDDSTKRGYQTPIIKGQKIGYFKDTMIAFKEGDRVNDHYSLMRAISEKLSDQEIEELAAYYSAKPSEDD